MNLVMPLEVPQKVWSVQKSFMTAVDIAIGIDSTLLVCTKSGVC